MAAVRGGVLPSKRALHRFQNSRPAGPLEHGSVQWKVQAASGRQRVSALSGNDSRFATLLAVRYVSARRRQICVIDGVCNCVESLTWAVRDPCQSRQKPLPPHLHPRPPREV